MRSFDFLRYVHRAVAEDQASNYAKAFPLLDALCFSSTRGRHPRLAEQIRATLVGSSGGDGGLPPLLSPRPRRKIRARTVVAEPEAMMEGSRRNCGKASSRQFWRRSRMWSALTLRVSRVPSRPSRGRRLVHSVPTVLCPVLSSELGFFCYWLPFYPYDDALVLSTR